MFILTTHPQSRTDLFPEDTRQLYYSLERYHIMGSRILSRSFHVEPWSGDQDRNDTAEDSGVDQNTDAMDVDGQQPDAQDENTVDDAQEEAEETVELGSDVTDDEDAENPADVAMVPMADMLNARYGSENVGTSDQHPWTTATHYTAPARPNCSTKQEISRWSRRNLSKQANRS